MNCHHSGHAIEKCWEEGGGSVGQALEWWKLARDRKDGQKGKQMRKGQAHAAIAKNSSDSGSESCALLSDSPECSVDWTNMLAPMTNSNTTSFTPPYLLNSGATSHCSPYHEDFIQLTSIPTREIKGINGSCVSAIAMGTIYIKCGKGQRLTLKDALYIPDVRLCLISIGPLSDDGLHTSFTATTCDIQHGSKMIAKGSWHGKGLYMLTDHPSVKRINIACAAVTLDTWHRWLGHVNYTSIMKMAEKKPVTGMPTSLSYLPQIATTVFLLNRHAHWFLRCGRGGEQRGY